MYAEMFILGAERLLLRTHDLDGPGLKRVQSITRHQESGVALAVKTHEMAVRIEVREGEPIGKAVRRFNQMCDRCGVFYRLREHKYREKPCEERRRKRYKAKVMVRRVAYYKRLELGLERANER